MKSGSTLVFAPKVLSYTKTRAAAGEKHPQNVFPHSNIKAQILEDENIGRVFSKAIELISACSAYLYETL